MWRTVDKILRAVDRWVEKHLDDEEPSRTLCDWNCEHLEPHQGGVYHCLWYGVWLDRKDGHNLKCDLCERK